MMPRGPKGEKRPADVIGAAVMVGRIATGEIEDIKPAAWKNPAAVALGRMGGNAPKLENHCHALALYFMGHPDMEARSRAEMSIMQERTVCTARAHDQADRNARGHALRIGSSG